jgi:hypothetical protein
MAVGMPMTPELVSLGLQMVPQLSDRCREW